MTATLTPTFVTKLIILEVVTKTVIAEQIIVSLIFVATPPFQMEDTVMKVRQVGAQVAIATQQLIHARLEGHLIHVMKTQTVYQSHVQLGSVTFQGFKVVVEQLKIVIRRLPVALIIFAFEMMVKNVLKAQIASVVFVTQMA